VFQCVAMCRSVWQCVFAGRTLLLKFDMQTGVAVCCSVLPCVCRESHCTTLQGSVCCGVLQCMCCGAGVCVAVDCTGRDR